MSFLSEKSVFRLIIFTLIVGILYRLYPLVAGERVLRAAFMTEDGYLMLTIARNMAIGLGMSVSDGTIASNGVQPLATFLFSVPYLVFSGDKVMGVAGVQLISAIIAVLGFFSVKAFVGLVTPQFSDRPIWPWMLAAIWFVSPLLLLHTMNGLETGLYTVMLTITLIVFHKLLLQRGDVSLSMQLLFGAAGGITFLARNDAVFFLFPLFAVWLWYELFISRRGLAAALRLIIPTGLVIVAISAPWMINNYVNFGSIVPVSGTAQALSGGFARNADLLPSILFEYTFPMLPIPARIEMLPLFQWTAVVLVLLIVAVFTILTARKGGPVWYVILAYLIYATVMSIYYGFYFGAGWFLSRYLSPLAPLLILATFSVGYALISRISISGAPHVMRLAGVLSLVLCFVLLGRLLVPGVREQGHFQVVDWVHENVPAETWVGAVQTGTLGYWHDRTINLDGKVNPDALSALLTEGHVLNYVIESPIAYLADWHGIALWATDQLIEGTDFPDHFTLIVHQPENNLAVMKRNEPPA